MAAELVNCPECKRTLRVPSDLLGKLVKCPTCGHTFTGNAVGEPPAPPAPPPPPPRPSNVKPPRTSKVGRGDEDDRDEEDEDEERARRRRLRASRDDEDEEDDDRRGRSRRRSRSRYDDDDDDYEDRRPRRRRDLVPHRGSLILILGIISFFLLTPVLGPMAWIMGNSDLAQIRAGRMDPEGYGPTNAGRICGMISTLLCIVGILFVVIICAGFTASAPSRMR